MRRIALILLAIASLLPAMGAESLMPDSATTIMGPSAVTADEMYSFVHSRNENFTIEIAEAFYYIGERYGIRGDIALCQAVLETGWFRFMDGTAVKPEHFNFGGLGVTGDGRPHNVYDSMIDGVTAMVQHLYAYACTEELPVDESLLDVRFGLVARGCAPTWEMLSGRWAMNDNYGRDILRIYRQMLRHASQSTF